MTPEELLEEIAAETRVCTRCPLHEGAHSAVPGEGPARAEIMLIGEAPSYVDDRRGTPFSGPSGVFLDELLAAAGLSRAGVFLTNIVKHYPPDQRELTAQEVGELRSGARANLLMGVASNRVDVHRACAAAERALEKRAEPLSALFVAPDAYPHALARLAWLECDSVEHESADVNLDAIRLGHVRSAGPGGPSCASRFGWRARAAAWSPCCPSEPPGKRH